MSDRSGKSYRVGVIGFAHMHVNELVDRFIATGRFNNKSEVIRAGLRLLEEHELHFERAARADLERILDEDLEEAEPATPAEQLFTRRKH